MSDYELMNEKQKEILRKINRAREFEIQKDETRIKGIKKIFNGRKPTHYSCQIYCLNTYLNRKNLFIYDADKNLYNFEKINIKINLELKNPAKKSGLIQWTNKYNDALIKIDNYIASSIKDDPHKYLIELIKVLDEIGFTINTRKFDVENNLSEKDLIGYMPNCDDLEEAYLSKYPELDVEIDESELLDLYEKQNPDKLLASNWRNKLIDKKCLEDAK